MAAVVIPIIIAAASTAAQLLLAPRVKQNRIDKGRFDDIRITGSEYGAYIPRIWGDARLAGNIVFSSGIDEQITETPGSGGKGVPSQPPTRTFTYRTDIGVLWCRGEMSNFGKLWADLDLVYNTNGFPGIPEATYQAESASRTGTMTETTAGGVTYMEDIDSGDSLTFTIGLTPPTDPKEPDVPIAKTLITFRYKCAADTIAVMSGNSGAWTAPARDSYFYSTGDLWSYKTIPVIGYHLSSFVYAGGPSGAPDLDYILVEYSWEWPSGDPTLSSNVKPVVTGIQDPNAIFPTDPLNAMGFYTYTPSADGTGKTSFITATNQTIRNYNGTTTQTADSALSDWLATRWPTTGTSRAMAFRGLAYTVLDNYVLKNGRVPNFTAELTASRAPTLANILEDMYLDVGLTSANYTAGSGTNIGTSGIVGAVENTRSTRWAFIEPILNYCHAALAEVDGKIVTKNAATSGSQYTIVPDTDLRAHPYGEEAPPYDAQIIKKEETQQSKQVRITFMNKELDYHTDTVISTPAYTHKGTEIREYNVPIVADVDWAAISADMHQVKEMTADKVFTFDAMPSMAKWAVGDRFALTIDGRTYEALMVTRKTVQIPVGVIKYECQYIDTLPMNAIYGATKSLSTRETPIATLKFSEFLAIEAPKGTKTIAVQNPILYEKNRDVLGVYIAACGTGVGDWGGATLYREQGPDNYETVTPVRQAPLGVTSTALSAKGDLGSLDTSSSLTINFYKDVELESITEAQSADFPYKNLLWVDNGNAGGEFIQFLTVSENALTADNPYASSWTVTNLWRERFAPATSAVSVSSGADCFIVDSSLVFVELNPADIGDTINFKTVTTGQAIDDATATAVTVSNVSPYSHVTGYADFTTTGTTAETLYQQTFPVNPFRQVGDAVRFEYWGSFASNANTKRLSPLIDGQTVINIDTNQNGGDWEIEGVAVRTDDTTIRVGLKYVDDRTPSTDLDVDISEITVTDFNSSIAFAFNSTTSTQAGDITLKMAQLDRVSFDSKKYGSVVTVGGVDVTVASVDVTV